MIRGSIENVAYSEDAAESLQNEGAEQPSNTITIATGLVTTSDQISTSNGIKMGSESGHHEMLLLEERDAQYKITSFHDEKIKEHLLDAVRRGSYSVVVTLVEGLDLNGDAKLLSSDYTTPGWSRREFPPLIVAAQLGHYDIIRFLISKGFTIEPPHDIQCACDNCRLDYLRTSQERLSLYKALANPIWMTLTTDDPILTAFNMSMKMKALASQEDEFEKEYLSLYKTCKQFAVALLSECYDSKEQETILNYSHEARGQTNNGDKRLDLLKMAISMEQKEVRFFFLLSI